MRLSERDLLLARTLIDSLDEDGYLRQPMDDLLPPLSDEPPVQDVEWRIALRHVQSLEPLGIGARTVQECLLLQLPSIVGAELQALATRIVCEELEGLAKRDLAGMAR
ncbi:RNA polymerase factor sigma-54, partial [Ideonella azotifigens]